MKKSSLIVFALFSQNILATNFGISSEDRIAQGNDVSFTSSVDVPVSTNITEYARDAVKLADGTLIVYNGTFDPVLSVYANNAWSDISFPGWSTANNGSYGGIASNDRMVWVTDMETFGTPEDEMQGIIQFDLDGLVPDFRFAEDIEPIDLTVGMDGFLYALYPGGSPEGRFINVYNPNDASFIKTISLADIFGHTGHRSIAVDADSNIYIADWDGDIQMIDSENNILATIDVNESLYDIDIVDNKVIAGDRFGKVFIADLQLQSYDELLVENLDPSFNDDGIFILGNSHDTSQTISDLIFEDDFE